MEKKNHGRDLEEISEIFLSTSKKKDTQQPAGGFSAVTIREETCDSCANMIEGSFKEPKCRIFTFEHERYGVPHLDTISLNYANYCENFEPETKERQADIKELKTNGLDLAEKNCEIEETVNVQKKIAYKDTEETREDIQKSLSDYLEAGYSIQSVELKKYSEASTPNGKKSKNEQIIIFVKNSDC